MKVGESAKSGRSRVALAAGLFVLGFTVVFVAATATVLTVGGNHGFTGALAR